MLEYNAPLHPLRFEPNATRDCGLRFSTEMALKHATSWQKKSHQRPHQLKLAMLEFDAMFASAAVEADAKRDCDLLHGDASRATP